MKRPSPGLAALLAAVALGAQSGFAADYPTTVKSDNPRVYYRLNDGGVSTVNLNSGSADDASATNLNVRAFPGAIVGDSDYAQFYNAAARSIVPFNAALNPDNTVPFTMEVWLYPASDQNNVGQAPLNNRYAYSGVDRQGWVIFQRSPNANYTGEPVGWNFRMFRGSGSATGLDVRAGVDYKLNTWTHLVVTYEPNNLTDARLTMYINGVESAVANGDGVNVGYVANTLHDPENANGAAGLAFGAYNNTGINAEGQTDGQNAYIGGIDEYAFYTNALAPEKILAHYQNATNTARAISYSALVMQDNPVGYYRLNEIAPNQGDQQINMGRLKSAGEATSSPSVQWNAESPLTEPKDHSFGYHHQGTGLSHTQILFNDPMNPSENIPMAIEFWVRADDDRINPGAAVMNNRKPSNNRTGWVIFQRSPNTTYSGQAGNEGVGYNLRMYSGSGGNSVDITTSVPYMIGEWQHLVFNWLPDGGEVGGGTLTCFVNGVQAGAFADGEPVPVERVGTYKANTNPTDDDTAAADFVVGSYNARGNFVQEFTGKIDEVAIYTNMVISAEQALAHYQAGTNVLGTTNYAHLVLTAPSESLSIAQGGGPVAPQLGPVTYLRFNDIAKHPAVNNGALGSDADAAFQAGALNDLAGPVPSAFPGFAAGNLAGNFPGTLGWLALNNPDGLNFEGQITMEAWIKPAADQGLKARIISHGPEIVTFSPLVETNGAVLVSGEVFLNIDNGNYVVGSTDGTNVYSATAAIPAGDLGSANWIHLAGVHDGANWKLYRNGVQIASEAAATGSLVITNGEWAVGSSGLSWSEFFAGGIDEVAIYHTALTPAKIMAHYNAASTSGPTATIGISLANNVPRITFSGGVLQASSTVNGQYTTINGATSPYTPTAGQTMQFFRVLQ